MEGDYGVEEGGESEDEGKGRGAEDEVRCYCLVWGLVGRGGRERERDVR